MAVELRHDDIKFDVGMNVIAANEVHTRHSLLGLVSNGMKKDATVGGIFMLDVNPNAGSRAYISLSSHSSLAETSDVRALRSD